MLTTSRTCAIIKSRKGKEKGRKNTMKKENIYCYSEKERDEAQAKLGKGSETSRFKGLGEISGDEFKQFITPDKIRLTPVEISQLKIIPQLLAFYMGSNTPERREFIEKNLLSNSEIDA